MSTVTRRSRRLAAAAGGLAAVFALALPAATAQAAVGYTPNANEWWMSNWNITGNVWPISEGAGVTVAVLDGGVQANIPDLQGVVEPGGDMLGDAGNGEQDYAPNGGHGTGVATLIAGQGIGLGPVGIAPQAKILPVHVLTSDFETAPLANGIRYAVDHGASVINMSIGGNAPSATSCDPQLQDAVSYALAHNVVLVAASGDTNEGGPAPQEPATCAGVLAVGAVEENGTLWQYSTQGPNVAVAAPGDHMYTVSDTGQQYSTDSSGTSFSAPLVAGAAALIRSKYPSMPWYTVVQRLIDTALPDGAVPNNGTGYGIVDVYHALDVPQYPVSASAPNPVYAAYQSWLQTQGNSGASTGPTTGATAPQASSPSKAKSGGSGTIIIVLVVVLVVIAGVGFAFVQIARNKMRGPRNPGGPGGSGGGYGGPPGGYNPPPGQYPQQGQQYPPPGQYPSGGRY